MATHYRTGDGQDYEEVWWAQMGAVVRAAGLFLERRDAGTLYDLAGIMSSLAEDLKERRFEKEED